MFQNVISPDIRKNYNVHTINVNVKLSLLIYNLQCLQIQQLLEHVRCSVDKNLVLTEDDIREIEEVAAAAGDRSNRSLLGKSEQNG